jgi:hypothetical protein
MEHDNTFESDRSAEDRIDDHLLRSLKVHGFVFSDTEDEVEAFYLDYLSQSPPLPENLRNSSDIFKNNEVKETRIIDLPSNKQIVENLAQAARDGSNIPVEVMEKMKKDRLASEKSKKS